MACLYALVASATWSNSCCDKGVSDGGVEIIAFSDAVGTELESGTVSEAVEIKSGVCEFCAEEIVARAIKPKASQVAFRAESLFLGSIL
jgi:hypothetical protein